jgi:RHS repeat-associated protein
VQEVEHDWNELLPTATRFTGPAAGAFTYQYDARYRVQSTTLASGLDTPTVAYAYDADNLRTSIGEFTLTRDGPAGAATRISDGTGTLDYGYDALGRIASRTLTVDGTVVYDADVVFDEAGRIVSQTETDATGTHVFAYAWDDDGQLLQVTRDAVEVEAYAYDDRGNRTSRSLSGGPAEVATVDAQDRLLTRGATTYASDAAGFLTARGSDVFTYSTAGELLESTAGSGVTYESDGLRRRVARTHAGGTTQYLYGNPDDDLQVTAVRDSAGTLTWYHYDDGGRLLALQRGVDRYYVATDATGSPRGVADASGTVVRRQRWGAFGTPLEDTAPAFHLALGFAGGLADPVTDLVRFGLRDYEPASGRWTSRDPILFGGGQGNLYSYVSNHPVGVVDRSGLASIEVSAYEGIGVDTKLSWTRDGISACFGLGFGGGVSLGLDPFGDLDDTKVALDGKIKGQLGPGKLEFGVEISECRNVKPKAELCSGLVCTRLDKDNPNLQAKGKPAEFDNGLLRSLGQEGVGIKGKLGAKFCQQARW